jgi:hypothetical protein
MEERMMADTDAADPVPGNYSELPIQPTGSGVADLEIAYEQMKLAEGADAGTAPADAEMTGTLGSQSPDISPTEAGDDTAESVAHPS